MLRRACGEESRRTVGVMVDLQAEARKNSFMSWFIIEIVSREKDFEDFVGRDPKRIDVKLVINGRELNAESTLERLGAEVDRLIESGAKEKARVMVDGTLNDLRAALLDKLQIEIAED